MKKLILTSNAYYPSIGGIENSLRHLAQEAVAADMQPVIVVGDIGVEPKLLKTQTETIDGVQVIRYPMQPLRWPIVKYLNLIVSCWLCWSIYRQFKKQAPDAIVVARFHFNAWLANLAGFKTVRYLVPSVVREQSTVEASNLSLIKYKKARLKIKLHNIIQANALKQCENFVFSETMLLQCMALAKNSKKNYTIVKPGVDSSRFHPVSDQSKQKLRENFGYIQTDKVLLFVGRFVKAKGVDLILEAISLANKKHIKLLMVGEGAEQQQYIQLVRKYNLSQQITILSPTAKVEKFYQLADVFIMSSCYEPLGQTLLEAFASGLPVIAFKRSDLVNTATQELGMDEFICYSNSYASLDLAHCLDAVKVSTAFQRERLSEICLSKFSWRALLNSLLLK